MLFGELKSWFVSLSNSVASLNTVELDVAVRGKVGGNATVGTVGSSAALLSSLDNNVSDNAFVGIKTLLFGVGFEVEEQLADSLDRLLGPSASGGALDLALGVS